MCACCSHNVNIPTAGLFLLFTEYMLFREHPRHTISRRLMTEILFRTSRSVSPTNSNPINLPSPSPLYCYFTEMGSYLNGILSSCRLCGCWKVSTRPIPSPAPPLKQLPRSRLPLPSLPSAPQQTCACTHSHKRAHARAHIRHFAVNENNYPLASHNVDQQRLKDTIVERRGAKSMKSLT